MTDPTLSVSDPRSVYRGRDRRLQPLGSAGGDLVVAGALTLAVAWALVIGAAFISRDRGLADALAVRGVLEAIAAAIAGIAGVLGALHWRLVGVTRSLWSGMALTVLAGLAIPALVAPGGAAAGSSVLTLRLALELSSLVIFGFGAARPPIDVSIRPVLIVGAAAAVTGIAAGVLLLDRGAALTVSRHPAVIAVAFAAVAVAYALRIRRDQNSVDPWRCLALLGMASSLAAAQLARQGPAVWSISEGGLFVLAMAFMAIGKTRALLLAYASQRRELVASALAAEDLDARSRAQRHDVTNALMGLGGAAATLERFHDNLNPADREELTRGLTREVSRLQAILDQTNGEHAPFALTAVLPEPGGSMGSVSVPAELRAVGDEEATRSVVRTLLAQAALRAPADNVTIKGERDGDWVVLRFTDGGPGIPRAERRTLFSHSGTPLSDAAKAMRRQGGDLWVDAHGRDTSFALCLPRAPNGSAPPG